MLARRAYRAPQGPYIGSPFDYEKVWRPGGRLVAAAAAAWWLVAAAAAWGPPAWWPPPGGRRCRCLVAGGRRCRRLVAGGWLFKIYINPFSLVRLPLHACHAGVQGVRGAQPPGKKSMFFKAGNLKNNRRAGK